MWAYRNIACSGIRRTSTPRAWSATDRRCKTEVRQHCKFYSSDGIFGIRSRSWKILQGSRGDIRRPPASSRWDIWRTGLVEGHCMYHSSNNTSRSCRGRCNIWKQLKIWLLEKKNRSSKKFTRQHKLLCIRRFGAAVHEHMKCNLFDCCTERRCEGKAHKIPLPWRILHRKWTRICCFAAASRWCRPGNRSQLRPCRNRTLNGRNDSCRRCPRIQLKSFIIKLCWKNDFKWKLIDLQDFK